LCQSCISYNCPYKAEQLFISGDSPTGQTEFNVRAVLPQGLQVSIITLDRGEGLLSRHLKDTGDHQKRSFSMIT
jgi:hypothetical protein